MLEKVGEGGVAEDWLKDVSVSLFLVEDAEI